MKNTLVLLLLIIASAANAQEKYATTFDELPAKMAAAKKPILIKIYTQWCSICKMQDRQLTKDAELKAMLKDSYYYIAFDAESRNPITFNGREYRFVPNGLKGGLHELAATLCKANSSYPCWVLLREDYTVAWVHNGFLKSNQLKALLSSTTN